MTYPATIAGCCRELLDASSEVRSLDELTALAVQAGRTTARYPEMSVNNALRYDTGVLALDGQRFFSVRRLLEGRVLTTATGPGSELKRDPWARVSWSDELRDLDLGPLHRVTPVVVEDSPPDETSVLAFRYLDGALTVETLPRDTLVEVPAFVASIRRIFDNRQLYQRDLAQEVLLACMSDDSLLRQPTAPLSELFPELRPPEPEPPRPVERVCPTCEGSGVELDWGEGPGSFGPPLPYGWQHRIERLERATFGT